MRFLKVFNNPFLLVAQGFVLGAALLWSTGPDTAQAAESTAVAPLTVVSPALR